MNPTPRKRRYKIDHVFDIVRMDAGVAQVPLRRRRMSGAEPCRARSARPAAPRLPPFRRDSARTSPRSASARIARGRPPRSDSAFDLALSALANARTPDITSRLALPRSSMSATIATNGQMTRTRRHWKGPIVLFTRCAGIDKGQGPGRLDTKVATPGKRGWPVPSSKCHARRPSPGQHQPDGLRPHAVLRLPLPLRASACHRAASLRGNGPENCILAGRCCLAGRNRCPLRTPEASQFLAPTHPTTISRD